MASSEAASVVERMTAFIARNRAEGGKARICSYGTLEFDELEALLAVVEAAKELDKLWPSVNWDKHYAPRVIAFKEALDALYTPDSAEEPDG